MPGATGGIARETRAASLTTVSARRSKWAATTPEESCAESFDADFMRQVKEVPAADNGRKQPNSSRQKSLPTIRETDRKPPSKDIMLSAAPETSFGLWPSDGNDGCSFGAWPSDGNDACSFGAWPGDTGSFREQSPGPEQLSPERAASSVRRSGLSPTSDLLEEEDADDASWSSPKGFESAEALEVPPVSMDGPRKQQRQVQISSGRRSGRSSSAAASPKRTSASPARSSSATPQKKLDPAEMQKQSDAFWENMAATLQAEQDATAGITRNTSKAKTVGAAGLTQTGMFATRGSASTTGGRRPPRMR